MRLLDLIGRIDAEVLTAPPSRDIEITRVCAGDRISDLLSDGTAETLLVTNLTGAQIFRVADLMDVPAICLLNGAAPETELITAAGRHGATLLVSPLGMFETCGRLYECLAGADEMN